MKAKYPRLLLACLLLGVISGSILITGATPVLAQEERPARCTVDTPIGNSGGATTCPDPSSIPGAPAGTAFWANRCYAIVVGVTTTITEKACDQPPFGGSSGPGAENSGGTQTPSAQRSEVDKACNDTDKDGSGTVTGDELQNCLKENPITKWIVWGINILSAGAGVIITLMIVIAGIQYSTAGANPQAVSAAKGRMLNAIISLLALFFLYAFLQWLVPGGIF